jgi:hypothetical protein
MSNGFNYQIDIKDADLFKVLGRKNEQAFSLLYKRLWNTLLTFAGSYLQDKMFARKLYRIFLYNSIQKLFP